jgi:hypothetical protein
MPCQWICDFLTFLSDGTFEIVGNWQYLKRVVQNRKMLGGSVWFRFLNAPFFKFAFGTHFRTHAISKNILVILNFQVMALLNIYWGWHFKRHFNRHLFKT